MQSLFCFYDLFSFSYYFQMLVLYSSLRRIKDVDSMQNKRKKTLFF